MRFLLLILALLPLLLPQPQSSEGRLFAETGWRVGGRLLEFWEGNGGLPIFGLPTTPQRRQATPEGGFEAQWFERNRLELHAANAAPYDVLLGRLGDELLRKAGRDWRAEAGGEALPGQCRVFEATGRQVCGPFLDYWTRYGLEFGDAGVSERESLALFGLPLTPPRMEANSSGDTVLTQWFERARFEYHPANPEPYKVLLGRLGAELNGEPQPMPELIVAVEPPAVAQGRSASLAATVDGAVRVDGSLGDAPLAFFDRDGAWRAYGGVPVLTPAGSRLPLRVEAALADGRTALRELVIVVGAAGYGTENIELPPDVNRRLEENAAQIAEERRMVNAVWAQVTPERLWSGRFRMPAEGRTTSAFGTNRSYNGGPVDSFHEGLDIAGAVGTPVTAPARGRVVLAEPDLLVRGGAVILDHGQGLHTGFWHMSEVLAQPGQIVEPGELIGRIGAKGMVTGPHLHWDVRIGLLPVAPLEWVEREMN